MEKSLGKRIQHFFQNAEEVMIYQVLSVFVFIMHPLYFYIYTGSLPGATDYLSHRVILALIAIIPLVLQLTNKISVRRFMNASNISLYLNTLWFIFIMTKNLYQAEYVVGYFIVLTAIGFSFNNMKYLLMYSLSSLIFMGLTFLYIGVDNMRTHWFPLANITFGMNILAFIILYVKLKYKKLLFESNLLLKKKNEEILDSIKYAKRIQEAILPSDAYFKQNLIDSFVLYKPKDIVSGDFYWMERVEDKVLFAAVDCTGHGVPGAFMSILGDNGLKKIVLERKILKPSEILHELTEHIIHSTNAGVDVKDGMDIAMCCLDMKTKILEYSGAYNPLYLLRDNTIQIIKATKRPIGRFKRKAIPDFENHTIQLETNDLVYIFSDGYADQFGGPNKFKFTYNRLRDILLENCNKSMPEQKQVLEQAYEDWKKEEEQLDDICFIGVRV